MTSFGRVSRLFLACVAIVVEASADEPAAKLRIKVEFRRAETKPADGLTEATVPGTGSKIYLRPAADATSSDIVEARSTEDSEGKPAVEVRFTKEGAKKMARISEQHTDKPLAILVEGKVISAPVVRWKFTDRALITGRFTKEDVTKLVNGINAK